MTCRTVVTLHVPVQRVQLVSQSGWRGWFRAPAPGHNAPAAVYMLAASEMSPQVTHVSTDWTFQPHEVARGCAVEALTVAPEVGEAGPSSAAPGTRAAPRAARGKQRRYAPPLVEEAPDKELPQVPAMPENTLVYRRLKRRVKLDQDRERPPIHQRVLRHGWYLR